MVSRGPGEEARGLDPRRLFWQGLWEHSLLRWESATLVALAMLGGAAGVIAGRSGLVPAGSWPAIPPLCLVDEIALVWASMRDPASHQRVVTRLLIVAFRPQRLGDSALPRQMLKALEIRARVEALVHSDGSFGSDFAEGDFVLQL